MSAHLDVSVQLHSGFFCSGQIAGVANLKTSYPLDSKTVLIKLLISSLSSNKITRIFLMVSLWVKAGNGVRVVLLHVGC